MAPRDEAIDDEPKSMPPLPSQPPMVPAAQPAEALTVVPTGEEVNTVPQARSSPPEKAVPASREVQARPPTVARQLATVVPRAKQSATGTSGVAPAPPLASPTPHAQPVVAAQMPANAPRRREPWSEPPQRRQLPRKLKLLLGGSVALVLLVIVSGHSRSSRAAKKGTRPLVLDSDLVVNEEDLKNRREVNPADFHPEDHYLHVAPSPDPESAAPAPTGTPAAGDDLAARRARRAADLDLVGGEQGAPAPIPAERGARRAAPQSTSGDDDRPLYVEPRPAPGARAAPTGGDDRLALAGDTVDATLVNPLELDGDGSTVVASTGAGTPFPPRSRLLGSATLSGSRVALHFRSAILPDGTEIAIQGEAQDANGTFGLAVDVPSEDPDVPSPARAVARDTVTGVVLDELGGGILGGAARDYDRRRGDDRPHGRRAPLTLQAGTPIRVFFHETVSLSTTR